MTDSFSTIISPLVTLGSWTPPFVSFIPIPWRQLLLVSLGALDFRLNVRARIHYNLALFVIFFTE